MTEKCYVFYKRRSLCKAVKYVTFKYYKMKIRVMFINHVFFARSLGGKC